MITVAFPSKRFSYEKKKPSDFPWPGEGDSHSRELLFHQNLDVHVIDVDSEITKHIRKKAQKNRPLRWNFYSFDIFNVNKINGELFKKIDNLCSSFFRAAKIENSLE